MDQSNQAVSPMPQYKCHKVVSALRIEKITKDGEDENRESDGSAIITPLDYPFSPFKVEAEYMLKHKPVEGGYYVVYEDGYKSFSPKEVFESGYTRIN